MPLGPHVLVITVVAIAADGASAGQLEPVGTAELIGIGVVTVAEAVVRYSVQEPPTARWDGGVLFDDGARDLLRLRSQAARSRAGFASDVTWYSLGLYPLLIDSVLVSWLGQGRGGLAMQLALMDLEALAINGLVTTVVEKAAGRSRPDAAGCGSPSRASCIDPARDRNAAFPSGHTSVAFTTASLLCVQHARLELYGRADAVVCPASLTLAIATGLLRIASDRHWSSDVLAGALIGSTIGASVGLTHLRASDARFSATVDRKGGALAYALDF